MKILIMKYSHRAIRVASCCFGLRRILGLFLLSSAAGSMAASLPAVSTVSGGPSQGRPHSYGYVDGDTQGLAQFHTPIGLALSGTILYVADRDNNAIRKLDLDANQTITFATNGINRIYRPVGVAVDGGGSLYVLNQGDGVNGNVLTF